MKLVSVKGPFKMMEPGTNPYTVDLTSTGLPLPGASDIEVMTDTFNGSTTVKLVDKKTGEAIEIMFE